MKEKYNKLICSVLILISFLLIGGNRNIIAKEKKDSFELTKQELELLDKLSKQKLMIGVSEEIEYDKKRKDRKIGSVWPILDFFEELELETEIITGTPKELNDKLRKGELDFLYNVPYLEAVKKEVFLSEPVSSDLLVLIEDSRREENRKERNVLRIGTVDGSPASYFTQLDGINQELLSYYPDTASAFKALEKGKTDALLLTKNAAAAAYNKWNLKIADVYSQVDIPYAVGTCKEELEGILPILNRILYQDKKEGDIRKKINEAKEQFYKEAFLSEESENIKALKKENKDFIFAVLNKKDVPFYYETEKGTYGILPDLLQYFKEVTGITLKVLSVDLETDEIESKLETGELSFAAGIYESLNNQKNFLFTEPIYQSNFILAAKNEQKEITVKEVRNYFWGCLASNQYMLNKTVLDGHTVDYTTIGALLNALWKEEVTGVFLEQGILNYYDLIVKKDKLKQITDLSIPYEAKLVFSKKEAKIKQEMDRLIHLYQLQYPKYMEDWNQSADNYQTEYKKVLKIQRKLKKGVVLEAAVILGLAALCGYFVYVVRKERNGQKLEWEVLSRKGELGEVIEVDLKKDTIRSTKGFEIFGIKRPEKKTFTLQEVSDFIHYDFITHYQTILEQFEEEFEIEYQVQRNGKVYSMKESGMIGSDRISSIIINRAKIQKEEHLKKQKTEYDSLTGLYNKDCYSEKICELVELYPDEYGIFAFFDLNHMTEINEKYGHETGDYLLIAFGRELMKRTQKKKDCVCFRLGGDEFGYYHGNITTSKEIFEIVEELKTIWVRITMEDKAITADYCCGAAIYNKDAVEMKKLMEFADIALCNSKQKKNRLILYESGMIK